MQLALNHSTSSFKPDLIVRRKDRQDTEAEGEDLTRNSTCSCNISVFILNMYLNRLRIMYDNDQSEYLFILSKASTCKEIY